MEEQLQREDLKNGMIVEYKDCLFKVYISESGGNNHDELYQDRLDGTCDQIPLNAIDFSKLKKVQ